MSSLGWTPGVAAFYRGKDTHSAALHLKLQAATAIREGYVQLDLTSGSAPFTYDWSRKIIWKFTLVELAAIIRLCQSPHADIPPITMKHDPKAKQDGAGERNKILKIRRGPRGGAFWDLSETHTTEPEKDRAHSFAMNDDELMIVSELFRVALVITMGWTAMLCTTRPTPFKALGSTPAARDTSAQKNGAVAYPAHPHAIRPSPVLSRSRIIRSHKNSGLPYIGFIYPLPPPHPVIPYT